ncbi:MAG: hypothetical protein IKU50_08110 [Bacteroidaceae bacterium]|nr:hypothetical protein [Bacteroidaceae bacterium]
MCVVFVDGCNSPFHYSGSCCSGADAGTVSLYETAALYGEIPAACHLRVDENFKITLPVHGNMIIEMEPLPKALYLLFLRHPEGIVLKKISDYRAELECIYRSVSRRRNPTVIHRLLDEITNPAGNMLHKNLSIIRAAFLKKMSPEAARLFVPVCNRGREHYVLLDASRVNLPHFSC